jgi:hypothetical protein
MCRIMEVMCFVVGGRWYHTKSQNQSVSLCFCPRGIEAIAMCASESEGGVRVKGRKGRGKREAGVWKGRKERKVDEGSRHD